MLELGSPSELGQTSRTYSITPFRIIILLLLRFQATQGASGTSPLDASLEYRRSEAAYAYSWYKNITSDMFS
ncbi:hypothetical protein PN36_03805 [Candidatus Thiomargarita nelsonii]|uniref:Flavocytochrome c sulphide dehydrogenase flavin-binding domain-containing protein n=1 Tax=Candidatus Thiomargarita nelsonii TaxID=1003181 RepID=A0A4E0QSI1_9GAMM|nr:hypothetical protein PN36_03805 [Candidatus Thiomargarita nelsonii]